MGYTRLFDHLAEVIDSNPNAISADASSNTYTASGIWLRGAPSKHLSERLGLAPDNIKLLKLRCISTPPPARAPPDDGRYDGGIAI